MSRVASLVLAVLVALLAVLLTAEPAGAARVADIRNTKHNLSATGPGTVKATSETQVCVFCHTPHGAENVPGTPLWNRKLSGATYTPYTSNSLDVLPEELGAQPGGTSKLCLSCHDGTMAISSVNVLNGAGGTTPSPSISMTGTASGGFMPTTGATTGFTRNLGIKLTNDHPISFTYDSALAGRDGELRSPNGTDVGTRSGTTRPKLPLDSGKVQCTTCHDPHVRETDTTTKGPGKFLRLNRFQEGTPSGGAFSETNDIICLACHDKAGQSWARSAHANPSVATHTYNTASPNLREFPANQPVWKVACLNCHDTHSVEGSRRLLREGASSGVSAIEETCYQCHSNTSILNSAVPNIRTEFEKTYRMPIRTGDQPGSGEERHDIGTGPGPKAGKDLVESQLKLGKGDLTNRHVECSDCHNPHRVIKNQLFNADPSVVGTATHNHAAGHTNLASGVLKGTTGVEPSYTSNEFTTPGSSFVLKRGDPPVNGSTLVDDTVPWVTREYQVCLKCHSTYAYDSPPALGSFTGGTPAAPANNWGPPANGLTQYTDQAMEFQAPRGTGLRGDMTGGHKALPASTTDSGAAPAYATRNHRSWHPVMDNTGRTLGVRGITSTSPWLSPWTGNVGSQTMYCTDCHGGATANGTSTPPVGTPWGPHGSANPFILKGTWSRASGRGDSGTLCFRCHAETVYAGTNDTGRRSAFYNDPNDKGRGNLHNYHANKISAFRCTWCHVAVPHGWKNRSLLVNLNDVGPEVGLPKGTVRSASNTTNGGVNLPPYYLNATLKILNFAQPGFWKEADCGASSSNNGRSWMQSGQGCSNAP